MFEFKILQSPERTQHGNYEHIGDELVIGSSEGDMIIDDPQLGPSQLKLYFQGDQAYLQNLYPDCDIKLNQLVLDEDAAPIKPRDNIQVGKTVISLIKLKPGPLDPPQLEVDEKAVDKFPEASREWAILKALEALAQGINADSPVPPKPPMPPTAGSPPKVPPPPPRIK